MAANTKAKFTLMVRFPTKGNATLGTHQTLCLIDGIRQHLGIHYIAMSRATGKSLYIGTQYLV